MKDIIIRNIRAAEIFNGLWEPTLKVVIETDTAQGYSIAPTGQSTGESEAVELRDGGLRYGGMGCLSAVKMVETEIAEALIGMDVTDQKKIDNAIIGLDGTGNKARIGSNVSCAVSAAAMVTASKAIGVPVYKYMNKDANILPVPMIDIISGSHYSYGASSEIQEFSVLPVGAYSFSHAMELSKKLYTIIRKEITSKYGALGQCVDAAGSFALPIKSCRETLDFIVEGIAKGKLEEYFKIGMDCAASEWYVKKKDKYLFEGQLRNREEMMDIYKELVKKYPIITIEDPFDQNDIDGFKQATEELDIQIVGDDFFVTNINVMKEKVEVNAANALLWKYNQVGTLTEAFNASDMAVQKGYAVMPSGRSGESEDSIISDLAVGLNAGQCKVGIPVRSENTIKYNRFLEIEKELGDDAVYGGLYINGLYKK